MQAIEGTEKGFTPRAPNPSTLSGKTSSEQVQHKTAPHFHRHPTETLHPSHAYNDDDDDDEGADASSH